MVSFSNWILIRTLSDNTWDVYNVEWLDADTLASCGFYNGRIKIWSVSTGEKKRTIFIPNGAQVFSLKLLNKIHLAAGEVNGYIYIYYINNGSLVATLQGHHDSIYDLVLLSDDLLASSCCDSTIKIWNLTTYSLKFNLQEQYNCIMGLKQINYQILASIDYEGTIKLWNFKNGEKMRTISKPMFSSFYYVYLDLIKASGHQETSASLSTLVSVGSTEQIINMWNWTNGECIQTFKIAGPRIMSLAVMAFNVVGPNQTTSKASFFILVPIFSLREGLCPEINLLCRKDSVKVSTILTHSICGFST